MKFLIQIIAVIGSGFLLQLFLPFWVIAGVAFVCAVFLNFKKPLAPFLAGLLGGMLLWGGMAWFQNMPNDGQLAERVSKLMGFGGVGALIILTSIIGGLLAGLGSLSGFYLRDIFHSEKQPSS